jgi:2-polyprenyl-6-methoxyphenol hydroxylase-like FAD-dependent oxidoreductase
MNAAIIDAWALARALKETAGDQPLSPAIIRQCLQHYDKRRLEFNFTSSLCHEMAQLITSDSKSRRALANWGMLVYRKNKRMQARLARNVAGYSSKPFSLMERLHQYQTLLLPSNERDKEE